MNSALKTSPWMLCEPEVESFADDIDKANSSEMLGALVPLLRRVPAELHEVLKSRFEARLKELTAGNA